MMMSRRTTMLKFCRRLAIAQYGNLGKLPSQYTALCHYEAPEFTTANWFSTFTKKCESMKIVPDKFNDDKYFVNDDPLDDDLKESRHKPQSYQRDEEQTENYSRRPSKSWSDERPSLRFRGRDSRNSEYRSERGGNFDEYDQDRRQMQYERPSRQFRGRDSRSSAYRSDRGGNFDEYDQDRHQMRDDGDDSLDSFLRRDSGRGQQDSRSSMEDLWNQVKGHKVNFEDSSAIQKNFYNENPDVTDRPQGEITKFMDTHQMKVKGSNAKRPVFNFEETGFPDHITEALQVKFDQPTPIQSIGWPHALSGYDIVGIAQTGSGKTLSFMLPAIVHILKSRQTAKGRGPIALVMCPTRELAIQCHQTVKEFRSLCKIRSAVVYGGQSKFVQSEKLAVPGLDLVIATPGRLLDFLSTRTILLQRCSFLVLDEADRMLDMGFEPQIRAIMGQIRPDRQVLMWSATWPAEIQELANDFLEDYVHVKIGAQTHTVNKDIAQEFQFTTRFEKVNLLLDHLANNSDARNQRKSAKALIFCETKHQCDRLQGNLRRQGHYCDVIHGGKTQSQRDMAMRNFRSGRASILVASEVAARGLDVDDIEFVINYDLPKSIDGYIHRVGRTGRAGRKGTAISYITSDDLDMIKPLIKVLRDVDHDVPEILHQLLDERSSSKSYRKMDRRMERGGSTPRHWNKFRY